MSQSADRKSKQSGGCNNCCTKFLENECDGSGPHAMLAGDPPVAETRRMETGGGAGVILCYSCYLREIRWRKAQTGQWVMPAWEELPVYATMARAAGEVQQ